MLALGKLLELTLAGREPCEKIQLTPQERIDSLVLETVAGAIDLESERRACRIGIAVVEFGIGARVA